jgi:hypothetical protein
MATTRSFDVTFVDNADKLLPVWLLWKKVSIFEW